MRAMMLLLGLFGAIVVAHSARNPKRVVIGKQAWNAQSKHIEAAGKSWPTFASKSDDTGRTYRNNILVGLCWLRCPIDCCMMPKDPFVGSLRCSSGNKPGRTIIDGVGIDVETVRVGENCIISIAMISVIALSGFALLKRLFKNLVHRAIFLWVILAQVVVARAARETWTVLAKNDRAFNFPSSVQTTGLYGQVSDTNYLNLPLWSGDKLSNGVYTLRLKYELGTIIWKQTSNPWVSKSTTVTGFQLVSQPTGWTSFAGLYWNTDGNSILRGTSAGYYAVGIQAAHFTLCSPGYTCDRMELSIENVTPSPSAAPTAKLGITSMIDKGYYDVQRVGVVFDPINCFTPKATITIKYSGRIRAIVLRWARGKIGTSPRAVQGRFGDAPGNKLMVVIVRKSIAGNDEVVFPRAGTVGYGGEITNTNLYTMKPYKAMSDSLIFDGPPLGVLAGSKIFVCSGDSVGQIQDADTNDGTVEYVVDLFYETPANQVNARFLRSWKRGLIAAFSVLFMVVGLCICVGVVYCRTSKKKALSVKRAGDEHLNLYGSVNRA